MKKTLAAVAILGAFAGSAMADVTVYGKVDLGLGYKNVDGVRTAEMVSGGNSTSRIGFKGSEKIADMTVGFQYEGAISADTGDSTLFKRIAMLKVAGAYGEVGAGYYGALDSGTGPYDLVGGLSAFGTGWYDTLGEQNLVMQTNSTRLTNAITYKAPAFAGVTLYAQVASGTEKADAGFKFDTSKDGTGHGEAFAKGDHAGGEFTHDVDVYYALGAQYKAGDLAATVVVSQTNWANKAGGAENDESLNVTAGVNYNFGVAKAYVAANYYESGAEGHDQYGFVVGADAPVLGGKAYVTAGYGEKTTVADAVETETETMMAAVGYTYPLSKQTYLYGGAGWNQQDNGTTVKDKYEAVFGMVHNF